MATFTSSWRTYGSGAQWRLVLVISDPPVVTKDTASVLVTAAGSIQTTGSLSDSSNTQNLGGAIEAVASNVAVSHGAGGGTTQVVSGSASISTVYGQPVGVTVAFAINGYEAFSGLPVQVAGLVTIPARPYQVPSAPTSVSVSRNSDTSHTVTWTRNVSTAAPYTSQQVQRATYNGAWGSWATIATVSGAATSYTDTTTVANRAYEWRVVAVNSAGSAAAPTSSTVWTTPAAPSSVTAAKSGSDIIVSWSGAPAYPARTAEIQESQDGGAYAALATDSASPYTHASPSPSVTHRYRVRWVTTSGPTLASAWVQSAVVQLAAPPNAPTGLGPSTVRDAALPVALVWTHNPVDTSAQRKFQVRHRAAGSPTWTEVAAVTSSASTWTLPGGTYAAPTTIEWQVRTWGQATTGGSDGTGASPWSATATLPTSSTPTGTIGDIGTAGVLAASIVSVPWAYYQAEGSPQAAWKLELRDAGNVLVESLSGVGDAEAATLATVLPDGSAWTVRLRVQSAAGLWSAWDTATFSVAYPLPPVPVLTLTWDPMWATVEVAIATPDPVDDEVAATHVDLYWSHGDEPEIIVAEGLAPSTTWTHPYPALDVTNHYRAVATSALPSTASSAVTDVETPGANALFISGGPGFSVVCKALSNPDQGIEPGPAEQELIRFEGRSAPLLFESEDDTLTLHLEADVLKIHADAGQCSSLAAWEALATQRGPRLWRAPGRWVIVATSISLQRPPGGHVGHVSVAATRIEG